MHRCGVCCSEQGGYVGLDGPDDQGERRGPVTGVRGRSKWVATAAERGGPAAFRVEFGLRRRASALAVTRTVCTEMFRSAGTALTGSGARAAEAPTGAPSRQTERRHWPPAALVRYGRRRRLRPPPGHPAGVDCYQGPVPGPGKPAPRRAAGALSQRARLPHHPGRRTQTVTRGRSRAGRRGSRRDRPGSRGSGAAGSSPPVGKRGSTRGTSPPTRPPPTLGRWGSSPRRPVFQPRCARPASPRAGKQRRRTAAASRTRPSPARLPTPLFPSPHTRRRRDRSVPAPWCCTSVRRCCPGTPRPDCPRRGRQLSPRPAAPDRRRRWRPGPPAPAPPRPARRSARARQVAS